MKVSATKTKWWALVISLTLVLVRPVTSKQDARNPCKTFNCKEYFYRNKYSSPNYLTWQSLQKSDTNQRLRFYPESIQTRINTKKTHPLIKSRLTSLASRQEGGCNGYENFIQDIEITALLMTTVSYFKALLGLILHILNQAYIFFSVHIVGTPERLTWLINQFREHAIPENIHRVIDWIGFFDYLVIRWVSFPTGNIIVIIGIIAHIIGGIALGLDWIVPFKDVFRDTILRLSGVDLEVQLAGYGCDTQFRQSASRLFS